MRQRDRQCLDAVGDLCPNERNRDLQRTAGSLGLQLCRNPFRVSGMTNSQSCNDLTPPVNPEFTRFVDWARARLEYLEHTVDADGIAEGLKERELFPEIDPLIDPPDDLIDE